MWHFPSSRHKFPDRLPNWTGGRLGRRAISQRSPPRKCVFKLQITLHNIQLNQTDSLYHRIIVTLHELVHNLDLFAEGYEKKNKKCVAVLLCVRVAFSIFREKIKLKSVALKTIIWDY